MVSKRMAVVHYRCSYKCRAYSNPADFRMFLIGCFSSLVRDFNGEDILSDSMIPSSFNPDFIPASFEDISEPDLERLCILRAASILFI